MKKKTSNIFRNTLVFAALLGTHAGAATLINWDFSGLTTATNNSLTPVLAAGSANATGPFTVSDLTGEGTLIVASANDANGEANLQYWDGTSSGTVTGTNTGWLQFTMTATPGNVINLDGLSISSWRNGTGAPPNMEFQYRADYGSGFGALTQFGSTQVDNASGLPPSFDTFSFTDSITGADRVQVRFAPVGGFGNLHINGLTASGAIVPEPSSMGLLGLGGMLLLRRRRVA